MAELEKSAISVRPWQHGAIFLFACLLLISRRPEAILHAQFYAEDGHVWFADAYNLGFWDTLFRAQDGYFQTFSRLGGALAVLAPMVLAPLVLNVIAIAAQALPASLLLMGRSSEWGSFRFRALLAAAFLALPNCTEPSFGITESQWMLAFSAFLLLVAREPRSWIGRTLDILFLLLSGMSGPFCFFLLPIAVFVAWSRRTGWPWAPVGALTVGALVQAYGLLVIDRVGRPHFPLGASPALFTRILGGNVVLGAVLGRTRLAIMPGTGIFLFLLCSLIAASVIVVVCFLKSKIEMRLFFAWTAALLAASLVMPAAYPPPGGTVWEMLAKACGVRYWLFPSVAFTWALLWSMWSRQKGVKILATVFLVVMCFSIVLSWEEPPFKDFHFADYARRFEAAPPGTVMVIPINPEGWNMRLVKHASR